MNNKPDEIPDAKKSQREWKQDLTAYARQYDSFIKGAVAQQFGCDSHSLRVIPDASFLSDNTPENIYFIVEDGVGHSFCVTTKLDGRGNPVGGYRCCIY